MLPQHVPNATELVEYRPVRGTASVLRVTLMKWVTPMKFRLMFVCWLAAAFLDAVSGRSHSGQLRAEGRIVEPPSTIEVSGHPKAIEEARRLAETSRAEELASLLVSPEMIWFFDRDSIDLLRQHRDRSIPSLKASLSSPTPKTRIAAAVLLAKLGEGAGRTAIVRFLGDRAARQPLLSVLGRLEQEGAGDWPELQEWVLARLDDPDAGSRKEAVGVAMQLNVSAAGSKLGELAMQPGGDPDGWIACCAARLGPSMALLDAVAKRLGSETNRDARRWLIGALEYLIRAADPAISQRAVEVTGRVFAGPAAAEYEGVGIPMALAERGGSDGAGLLRRLYESGGSSSVRGATLL